MLCRDGGNDNRQSLCSRDGYFGETRQRERKVSTTALNSPTMVRAGVAAQRKATTGRLSKSRKVIFKQFSGVIERDVSLTQGGQDVGGSGMHRPLKLECLGMSQFGGLLI